MSGGKAPRRKGFEFEREVVRIARADGLEAERCFGSDGRSRGLSENVDLVIAGEHFQAKRMKRIASQYKPDANLYGQVFREDRGEPLAVIRLESLLALLALREE